MQGRFAKIVSWRKKKCVVWYFLAVGEMLENDNRRAEKCWMEGRKMGINEWRMAFGETKGYEWLRYLERFINWNAAFGALIRSLLYVNMLMAEKQEFTSDWYSACFRIRKIFWICRYRGVCWSFYNFFTCKKVSGFVVLFAEWYFSEWRMKKTAIKRKQRQVDLIFAEPTNKARAELYLSRPIVVYP